MMPRTTLCLLVAGSATAQHDMLVTVEDFNGDDSWSITAEFLTTPPSPIVQLWSIVQFELQGDGSDITFFGINSVFEKSSQGNVFNGPVASFFGSVTPFFDRPDSSNPLAIVNFDYAGNISSLDMTLIGQNAAVFELEPFGDFRQYQNTQGDPGELTYDIRIIPAPASFALIPLALAATRRGRK
ncbi:MAG: hypothetical protein AAFY46_02280 [Planctomycetota bacterium]